jgi:hypothetical protein
MRSRENLLLQALSELFRIREKLSYVIQRLRGWVRLPAAER